MSRQMKRKRVDMETDGEGPVAEKPSTKRPKLSKKEQKEEEYRPEIDEDYISLSDEEPPKKKKQKNQKEEEKDDDEESKEREKCTERGHRRRLSDQWLEIEAHRITREGLSLCGRSG